MQLDGADRHADAARRPSDRDRAVATRGVVAIRSDDRGRSRSGATCSGDRRAPGSPTDAGDDEPARGSAAAGGRGAAGPTAARRRRRPGCATRAWSRWRRRRTATRVATTAPGRDPLNRSASRPVPNAGQRQVDDPASRRARPAGRAGTAASWAGRRRRSGPRRRAEAESESVVPERQPALVPAPRGRSSPAG